jgi:hypothetical protein
MNLVIELSPDMIEILKHKKEELVTRFGRDSGPSEPALVDRDAEGTESPDEALLRIRHESPTKVTHLTVGFRAMNKAWIANVCRLIEQGLQMDREVKPFKKVGDRVSFSIRQEKNLEPIAFAALLTAIRTARGVTFAYLWGNDRQGPFCYEFDGHTKVVFTRNQT